MISSTRNERQALGQINQELTGLKPGETISQNTARLIAATVHRGVNSELKHFAETGVIRRHQVARLELFYTLRDEPGFGRWAQALRGYITHDEWRKRHQDDHEGGRR